MYRTDVALPVAIFSGKQVRASLRVNPLLMQVHSNKEPTINPLMF
ncbi:MAG: hypothetical protein ACOC2F_05160 [Bacteroidota bacterium]